MAVPGRAWPDLVCAEMPCAATSQQEKLQVFKNGVSSFDSERPDSSLNLISNYRWSWCTLDSILVRQGCARIKNPKLHCFAQKKCGFLSPAIGRFGQRLWPTLMTRLSLQASGGSSSSSKGAAGRGPCHFIIGIDIFHIHFAVKFIWF